MDGGGGYDGGLVAHVTEQFGGHDGLEQRAALHRNANGLEDFFAWRPFQQVAVGARLYRVDDAFVVVKGGKDDDSSMCSPFSRAERNARRGSVVARLDKRSPFSRAERNARRGSVVARLDKRSPFSRAERNARRASVVARLD